MSDILREVFAFGVKCVAKHEDHYTFDISFGIGWFFVAGFFAELLIVFLIGGLR